MISGEQFFILGIVRRFLNVNLPAFSYLIFAIVILVVLSAWLMRRRERDGQTYVRGGLFMATAFMVLLSPHFAWYFAWLIPFLCLVPSVPVCYLTLASFALYLMWLGDAPDRVLRLKALPYF